MRVHGDTQTKEAAVFQVLEEGHSSYVVGDLWGRVGAGRAKDAALLRLLAATQITACFNIGTYDLYVQVGFGLYPVVVKLFAEEEKADPIVFSFYR